MEGEEGEAEVVGGTSSLNGGREGLGEREMREKASWLEDTWAARLHGEKALERWLVVK